MKTTLLILFACNLHVKIATPPQEKTDSTYKAIAIITNGREPYTHFWSNETARDYATFPKSEKTISVTVTDLNGCIARDTLIIP